MSANGIYHSGLGALGQSLKMDVIANNLANVSTPGFRRDQMSFRERLTEALEDRPDYDHYNALVDRYGGAPFIDGVGFEDQAGAYEQTHNMLDFALQSKGFFTVQEVDSGRTFYTRAGNFKVDQQGRLTTADGRYQVLADDGSPLNMDISGANDLRSDSVGLLFQGGSEVGRLGIVDFADLSLVRKHGDNLFENIGSATVAPENVQVAQGTLEGSSVSPVTEMADMIKSLRALETNLQMIRFQDGVLDRVVNDFGRSPK